MAVVDPSDHEIFDAFVVDLVSTHDREHSL